MFAKYSALSPNGQRLVRIVSGLVLFSLVVFACLSVILKQQRADQEKLSLWHGDETRVAMYTTSSCAYCLEARMYFAQNGIEYKEFNIEDSSEYHKRFVELAGSGTPLMYVDKKRMDGFNSDQFDKLYTP